MTEHVWTDAARSGHDPKLMVCARCGATGKAHWRPFDPFRIGPRWHPTEPDEGVDPDCDVETVRRVMSL